MGFKFVEKKDYAPIVKGDNIENPKQNVESVEKILKNCLV
jgi:ferritin